TSSCDGTKGAAQASASSLAVCGARFEFRISSGVKTMSASDAYMELSDEDVWGETYDDQFGEQGRSWGAFEVSSFDFGVTSNRKEMEDSGDTKSDGKSDGKKGSKTVGSTATGLGAALQAHPTVKQFTIHKWIDKASPDLFLFCCQQRPIQFAKLFF